MATLFQKPSMLTEATGALSETKVLLGRSKGSIAQLKDNEKQQKEIISKTVSNENRRVLVKKRPLIIFVAAMVEAVLSLRAFGFILHDALNFPVGKLTWALDFVFATAASWLIIEGALRAQNFERQLATPGGTDGKPIVAYLLLAIVPLINLAIFFKAENKSDEVIFMALSVLTYFINLRLIALVSKSINDSRFDSLSQKDGEKLKTLEDAKERIYKVFDQTKHRVEFIAPNFITAYKQLTPAEQNLIALGTDYMYVLQERVFAGQGVTLVDASAVKPTDYEFISNWDKVTNRQSLI